MDNNKNVLYISYDGMTDPLGQSQVLPYIIGLSKKGYRFTLISAEKPVLYEQNRGTIESICQENNINWIPIPYTKSPPVFSTLKDLRSMKQKAFALHSTINFVLVHCRGYISALVGQSMKKKFGTGFLFDMRGLWPDEKVDAGAWDLKNPLFRFVYNYYKKKEKQFFLEADYTVSLTEAGRKEVKSWSYLKDMNLKMELIPCATDASHFDPKKISETDQDYVRKELNIKPADSIICYLGSIGTWYMLDEMLDFFKRFLLQKPSAKMLFITGSEHELIIERANKKDIPASNLIIRKASRKEVPLYLSVCDYSIFFIRASYSKISSSPTKQGELMAMGIPIVCNAGIGDTDSIVENFQSGVVVKNYSNESYDTAVRGLLETTFDKEKIRNGALSYFSLDDAVAKYKYIYTFILKKDL